MPEPGQYFQEPSTGAAVFSREGKVYLRPKNWEPGKPLLAVEHDRVSDALSSGDYLPATAEDVQKRDVAKAHDTLGGQVAAGAKAFAAGAMDATAFIPRTLAAAGANLAGAEGKDLDPLGEALGGRQVQENAAYVMGELLGESGEKAQAEYAQTSREQAQANPLTTGAAYTIGQLVGGVPVAKGAGALGGVLGRGSALAGQAIGSGIEGAAMGLAGAGEAAYLEDADLTGEKLLAGMGWGALIGGGVGLTIGGAGRLFKRAGSRGATPVDSPQVGALRRSDEALDATAARALGDVPATPGLGRNIREALEDAQAAVGGVDRQALKEVGATRGFMDPTSSAYKGRSRWWNREKIWSESTERLTKSLEQAAGDADDVFEQVVDAGLKREHIAAKLTGDKSKMVQTGWEELSRVKSEIRNALEQGADDFGNSDLLKRKLKYIDAIEPGKATAEDAFIALDRTKRALQKDVKALRSSSSSSGDALKQMQGQKLANYLEGIQERVRTGLEDATVWGEAGDAQKAINARWGEYIRTQQTFRDSFMRRVEGVDYQTGRPVFRVDPDKVAAYIRRTGRQEGALVDEYFRRHIEAREALAKEISGAFDTGADKVTRLSQSTSAIKSTLTELDETARSVNQVQAIMEAESSSGATGLGAILGGVLGGAPGAVVGGAIGAVSKPGTMIRQAAAIEQLARNLDSKVAKSIKAFFDRASNVGLPRIPGAGGIEKAVKVAGRAAPALRIAPTATALEVFRGREANNQKAYRKRAGEVLAASENFGERIRGRASESLGELPTQMPRLAGAVVTRATVGAEFLKSKLPAPLVNTRSLTPMSRPPIVSDVEIAKFAKYYSAVSNPLSALDDLQRGTLSAEQVEALRVVYPKLYQQVQNSVREQLLEMDQKGTPVSYQARLQLDLLLDLGGAGEPTASPDFMARFADYAKQQPQGGQRPSPPPRPVNIATRLRAGSASLDPTSKDT